MLNAVYVEFVTLPWLTVVFEACGIDVATAPVPLAVGNVDVNNVHTEPLVRVTRTMKPQSVIPFVVEPEEVRIVVPTPFVTLWRMMLSPPELSP